jgi:hypothetical protein
MPPVRKTGFEKRTVLAILLGARGPITSWSQNYPWMQQNLAQNLDQFHPGGRRIILESKAYEPE